MNCDKNMAAIDRLIGYADLKFLVNLDLPKSENFVCGSETKSVSAPYMLQLVFVITF